MSVAAKGRERGDARFQLIAAFVLPGLLLYTLFLIWPLLQASYFSLFSWNGLGHPTRAIGLSNYSQTLGSGEFWSAFQHNLFFMAIEFVLVVPMALGLAVVLTKRIRFAVGFRLLFFLPFVLADVTAGLIWRYLLDGNYGLLAGFGGPHVLADRQMALWAVGLVMVWKSFGFHLILFIAALQQIDPSLYEAADIDGATRTQKLFTVTLPLIAPTIALSGFFIVVASIQAFDVVWSLTYAGPSGATSTLVTHLYEEGIASWRIGYGSAVGVVIFLLTVLFALSYRRVTERYE